MIELAQPTQINHEFCPSDRLDRALLLAYDQDPRLTLQDGLALLSALRDYTVSDLQTLMHDPLGYNPITINFLRQVMQQGAHLENPTGLYFVHPDGRWHKQLAILGLYFVGLLSQNEVGSLVPSPSKHRTGLSHQAIHFAIKKALAHLNRVMGTHHDVDELMTRDLPIRHRVGVANTLAQMSNGAASSGQLRDVILHSGPDVALHVKRAGSRRRVLAGWGLEFPDPREEFRIAKEALIGRLDAFDGSEEQAESLAAELANVSLRSFNILHDIPDAPLQSISIAVDNLGYKIYPTQLFELVAALRQNGVFVFSRQIGVEKATQRELWRRSVVTNDNQMDRLEEALSALSATDKFKWLNR